ncbi:MAG: U32 family peptidase [Clostridia bacterium]|nr:U32 family peptidase [Clostridia bacterium]
MELLAPAGDENKLLTALHFGADAVYFASKKFGLRAYATNFDQEGLKRAVDLTHAAGKKAYVTVNIFASNRDFGELSDYLSYLEHIGADGAIVSDPGVAALLKRVAPSLDLHISTQANVTNKYAAGFWRDFGAKRIVLARELSLSEITEINEYLDGTAETEVFIHGAMCISYSGRCLLSSYLTDRDSNRGECVQACRWEYALAEKSRTERPLTMTEDERGTYILNSKDMNTLPILDKIVQTGVSSLKIEGRMKSEYYVGCVTDAYRKAIDGVLSGAGISSSLEEELYKVNHRDYCTGFYLGKAEQCYETSKMHNEYRFCATVVGYDEQKGMLEIEMRNRFFAGDVLEAVSPMGYSTVRFDEIYDAEGNRVTDCKIVQQRLFIPTALRLQKYDILRKKESSC